MEVFHCGAKPVSYEELCAVELPPMTASYRPVPHGDLVRLIERETKVRTGLEKPERSFGVTNDGN